MKKMMRILIVVLLCTLGFLLLSVQAWAAGPTKIEVCSTPGLRGTTPSKSEVKCPNPTAQNDTFIFWGEYNGTTDIFNCDTACTITDDKSNTCTVDETDADTINSTTLIVGHCTQTTGGARIWTFTYSSATSYTQFAGVVVNNIATSSPKDVTCGAFGLSGTSIACGSMTTTQANDYIVCANFMNSGTQPGAVETFTTSDIFNLLTADPVNLLPAFAGVQTSAGGINPTLTWSYSAPAVMAGCAAYKTAVAGGVPGTGLYVRNVQNIDWALQTLSGTSTTVNMPCQSSQNVNLIVIGYGSNASVTITGVSDSNSNTWNSTTATTASTVNIQFWYATNATCTPTGTVTFTSNNPMSSGAGVYMMIWTISGAASSPFDVVASRTACPAGCNQAAVGFSRGTLSHFPDITPTGSAELITAYENHDAETVTSVSPGSNLAADYGVYELTEGYQDGGVQHVYNASGTQNLAWTFSAYEGGTPNIGDAAAQAIAWLPQTVNQAGTTTALTSSPNPITYGQSVTLTATISSSSGTATPTGVVTFLDGSITLGSSTLDASGAATFSTANLSVGAHSLTARYNGDSDYSGSSSLPALSQTVNIASTTTTLSSSANPSNLGPKVTFTATVSPSAATGTVTFYDNNGSTLLGSANLSGGKASLSTSTLSAGTHYITAKYGGNSKYASSTSAVLTQTVRSKK